LASTLFKINMKTWGVTPYLTQSRFYKGPEGGSLYCTEIMEGSL